MLLSCKTLLFSRLSLLGSSNCRPHPRTLLFYQGSRVENQASMIVRISSRVSWTKEMISGSLGGHASIHSSNTVCDRSISRTKVVWSNSVNALYPRGLWQMAPIDPIVMLAAFSTGIIHFGKRSCVLNAHAEKSSETN